MNPHYHHPLYPDLHSPHSPNSDGVPSSYLGHTPTGGPPNGHIMGSHHDHMHQHPAYTTGGGPNPLTHQNNGPNSLNNYHHHHHYHHYLNNNNNNSSNNNNNNSSNNSNSNNSNQNSSINSQNHNSQHHNSAVCAGCNSKIMDRYFFKAMDRHWHHGCLKCQLCHRTLADMGSSCFTKDNMILCKPDYIKVFGNTGACTICGNPIPASDYVMRVGGGSMMNPASANHARGPNVYHLSCFNCTKCNARLEPGDKYCVLTNGHLVCEKDWPAMFKGSGGIPPGQQTTAGTTVRKGKVGRPRRPRD